MTSNLVFYVILLCNSKKAPQSEGQFITYDYIFSIKFDILIDNEFKSSDYLHLLSVRYQLKIQVNLNTLHLEGLLNG